MSQRAITFVEKWVAEKILPEPYVDADSVDPRPGRYAEQCARAAESQGIPRGEIDEEYPDLADHMAEAIDDAADAEVRRQVGNDD